jgi:hypothetical protein
MSNEPFAKAKSWELRFYRTERRKASKKTHCFSNKAFCGCIGFSEDDELRGKATCDLAMR